MVRITYCPTFRFDFKVKLNDLEAKRKAEKEDYMLDNNRIRMSINDYSRSLKEFAQNQQASSVSTYALNAWQTVEEQHDIFTKTLESYKKRLSIFNFKSSSALSYGYWENSVFEQPVRLIQFDFKSTKVTSTKGYSASDFQLIKDTVLERAACLMNFPDDLNSENKTGRRGEPIVKALIYDERQKAFQYDDNRFLQLRSGNNLIGWSNMSHIQSQIVERLKAQLTPKFKIVRKFVKSFVRNWKTRQTKVLKRVDNFLKKENIINFKLLGIFRKYRMAIKENRQTKKALSENDSFNAKNITLENLANLVKKQKERDIIQLKKDLTSISVPKDFVDLRVGMFESFDTAFEVHYKKMSKFSQRIKFKALRMTTNLHVKIAESRENFMKNNFFLEREKWFGFARNSQLVNMLDYLGIDNKILEMDWNDSVYPENSKRIKIALSSLCSLTNSKQYIAFSNSTNTILYDEKISELVSNQTFLTKDQARMFCTIFGLENWSFPEFRTHLFNHYKVLDNIHRNHGLNWAVKNLRKLYNSYISFRKIVPNENLIVRKNDKNGNVIRTDGSSIYSDLFLNKDNQPTEQVYARSFDAGVFHYVKEATSLIKNRSKVIMKRWLQFCEDNDIHYQAKFGVEERSNYDKVATELVKEKLSSGLF